MPLSLQAPAPLSTADVLPVFDLGPFLAEGAGENPTPELLQQCKELADCLARTGCLVVRDPRVAAADSDRFLDLLEAYFSRSEQQKLADARPELAYQVGATPAGIETPRCLAEPEACAAAVRQLPHDAQPVLPTAPDPKWRFFWRLGDRPASTAYPELNAPPVVPDMSSTQQAGQNGESLAAAALSSLSVVLLIRACDWRSQGVPGWQQQMDAWGGKLLAAVDVVARMAALGFDLPGDAFTRMMAGGPHLLAPTGSDLQQHGAQDTVLAGFHYDLNFITIHGRSRFPGLNVWLADGRKLAVSIPPGCLLCQAGKQLEWLTGGAVKAGMHEVVVGDATLAAVAAAQAAGRCCWRVSSTVFSHIASDVLLQPLGRFNGQAAAALAAYPPTPAGQQVQEELEAIKLKRNSNTTS